MLKNLLILALLVLPSAAFSKKAEEVYGQYCASCHGASLKGGSAGGLIDKDYSDLAAKKALFQALADGMPQKGMPAYKNILSSEALRSLAILIQERAYAAKESQLESAAAASPKGVFKAAGYSFTKSCIAETPRGIWSFDFLPDGSILATQKEGTLWHIKDGNLTAIKGTPEPWVVGQGGLLEVAVHPDYAKTPWVYLSLSASQDGKSGMTKVVRGQIKEGQWTKEELLYEAPDQFHSSKGHHFGSRFAFKDGYLFFSVGDRGDKALAQDLGKPNGKIHRIHDDGRVPKDNPFVGKQGLDTIWSYGHRNPQGLAINPADGTLWDAEHGPRGGDEINLVKPGTNYGWPVISYGMNYNGTPLTGEVERAGMAQPEHYWVPSIAVSEIDFYVGEAFPKWKGKMLASSLAKQELRLLAIKGGTVVEDSLILKGLGRIRDVASGPDGLPYFSLNNEHGQICRLSPQK